MHQHFGRSTYSTLTMQGEQDTMAWNVSNEKWQADWDIVDWGTSPTEKIFWDEGDAMHDCVGQQQLELHQQLPQKPAAHSISAISAMATSKLHSINYNAPPKRPHSAYEIFVKVERERVVTSMETSGYDSFFDVPFELAKVWKEFKSWEKDVYRQLARMERQLYNEELKSWKARRKLAPAPIQLPAIHATQNPGAPVGYSCLAQPHDHQPTPFQQSTFMALHRNYSGAPSSVKTSVCTNEEPTYHDLLNIAALHPNLSRTFPFQPNGTGQN